MQLTCAEAYDYRIYQADSGLSAKNTGAKVADKLVQMLWELKYTNAFYQ